MINQDFYIARLISQYLSGEITPDEAAQLDAWRIKDKANEQLFRKICSEENYACHAERKSSYDPNAGWLEVQKRIRKSTLRSKYLRIMRIAAIWILPVTILITALNHAPVALQQSETDLLAVRQITPGEAKAILTLNNGETIYLDKNTDGQHVQMAGEQIQIDSTTLSYRSAQKAVAQTSPIYNKVEIPNGGEYALVLNDGTKVRLNSMSSLRFPVVFGDGKREVELSGEAYFEVSKSAQPFIVHTKGIQIEVLGTVFNISAYPGEEYQATLVSGSVKVANEEGKSQVLKPSQQASITPGETDIQVRTVDTSFYTSWVKGKINFKDQRLEDIMKVLSRWYDIEVVYAHESLKDRRFGCNIDRYDEIAPFIAIMEATNNIHVKIKGKTITFHN